MPQTHKVDIEGPPFVFKPASITIASGDTVEWTNQTERNHTVKLDPGPSSGPITPDGTYPHVFNTSGTVPYHCEIHPAMKGTVIVK
jgi:plastocyanin